VLTDEKGQRSMKILFVDDNWNLLERVIPILTGAGLDVWGLAPNISFKPFRSRLCTMNGSQEGDNGTVYGGEEKIPVERMIKLAREADVIFLDHNMFPITGEDWLAWCREKGILFERKRVIGISSDHQGYLDERFFAGNLYDPDDVKRFLDTNKGD